MMAFGIIGMFLFWVLLILLGVFLVSSLFHTNRPSRNNQPMSARQILEQRYARGEIDQELYLLMLKDIQ
jgi:putative membrane protein